MDSNEKRIEDFAYAADISLPAARKVTRLLEEGIGLFEGDRRRMAYVVQRVSEAIRNGEQWARELGAALVRQTVRRCVEREADPAGAIARRLRVDRATAEQWVRQATAR
ncbi:hypothetical protein [Streptomyces sp. NPDC001604]|uniref:hypothetical protein n=1 Tax=Streptomyces sp. NPDC001604 TaxID=3364593 RepID=UPI0036B2218E